MNTISGLNIHSFITGSPDRDIRPLYPIYHLWCNSSCGMSSKLPSASLSFRVATRAAFLEPSLRRCIMSRAFDAYITPPF